LRKLEEVLMGLLGVRVVGWAGYGEEAGEGLRRLQVNVGAPGIVEAMVDASVASVEPVARKGGRMEKFMLSLSQDSMKVIVMEAERRGVSVQELIRAVIIPDWLHENVRKD
jgi:hypothetical protein